MRVNGEFHARADVRLDVVDHLQNRTLVIFKEGFDAFFTG